MAQTSNAKWQESYGRCVSPWLAALEAELPGGAHEEVFEAKLPFGQPRVESTATLRGWLAPAKGGLALRMAYAPGALKLESRPQRSVFGVYRPSESIGRVEMELTQPEKDLPLIRWKTILTPAMDLVVPFWPRDLIPVDVAGHPLKTRGMVHDHRRCGQGRAQAECHASAP